MVCPACFTAFVVANASSLALGTGAALGGLAALKLRQAPERRRPTRQEAADALAALRMQQRRGVLRSVDKGIGGDGDGDGDEDDAAR